MALTPGSRLGPYEVTALLGEGGMGQVYRATDTNLKRQVAIKVLPASVAADADRLARFQREAEVLAALNHPNIAAIHGLERTPDFTALVMELVEGDDLSQRIARGAIPVDEALPIAKQIAEALEAAHEQGIIHRDLKPANIKVRADGTVKVLDFGLAKALDPAAASSPEAMNSPTITSPAMTQAGMILGTAAYMAPEQARGKTVDKRADIWAFGAVVFEMLTGQRAFNGDDIADVMSRVLQREPDFEALPQATPARVRAIVARCLVKDPRQRLRDIGDVRLALEGAFETAAPLTAASATASASHGRLPWMVATAAAVVGMVALTVPTLRHLRETPPPETRVDIVTPASDRPADFALSPDGRQIVFVAAGDGPSRLWRRSLATTAAQPLAGTDGALYPFWSPDGRSIGFFADGQLKRIDLNGGAPQTLAPASAGRGGTWNADGAILFAPTSGAPLLRVPASGGPPVAVTTLAGQQAGHRFPVFLPDGRHFVFYAQGAPDSAGIYLGTLVAQRLDVAQAALTGDPVTLADPVVVDINAAVSVSTSGLVAYRTGASSRRHLAWVDRSGKALGLLGAHEENGLTTPSVPPDGQRVAVARTVQGNTDLWLLDGPRTSRFTFDAALDRFPVWAPDGTRIAFYSNRTGTSDLYVKAASGAGVEEVLVASPQTNRDLWVLPLDGDRTPGMFLKTPYDERHGTFSPDGRWVAYSSNESGREEIYIRPFAGPAASGASASQVGGQWQVSTAGGIYPRWRADGRELYYLAFRKRPARAWLR